ncbi:hypothetical protein K439DRAFT_1369267 [Ramaria rubella]|nr:hypothetical protein K439DRAFT_1369267 [Ramaria rubella]
MRRELALHDVVAWFFVGKGIPFKTLICRNKTFVCPLDQPFRDIRLGWQPIGYRPMAIDYIAYEAIRNEFFHQPRAWAALMYGGIIWRLAIEHIGPEHVLIGPTDEVYRNGEVIRPDGDHEYWDDFLSVEELDLICGVYHCETSKLHICVLDT